MFWKWRKTWSYLLLSYLPRLVAVAFSTWTNIPNDTFRSVDNESSDHSLHCCFSHPDEGWVNACALIHSDHTKQQKSTCDFPLPNGLRTPRAVVFIRFPSCNGSNEPSVHIVPVGGPMTVRLDWPLLTYLKTKGKEKFSTSRRHCAAVGAV